MYSTYIYCNIVHRVVQLPGDLQYKERDSLDPMLDDLLEAIQLTVYCL